MKNMFLLIVAPLLLVPLGFGQAPSPSGNTDQGSIKGCLGGSHGNYTLAEDGTTQTFKVTGSTVDLSAHVGHDVEVIGQKANADTSSGASDNSVVVTGVNMISNQCATTSAAAAGTPIAADPTPTATAASPAVTASTPVATASTPAASDQISTATADSPAVTDSTPTATASATENNDQLPATATPLPLLGLLGLGLLATGLLSWKSQTN